MANYRKSKTKLTTQQFIERAKQIHGDKYDYSKVDYVNSRTPVEIICLQHGSFYQKGNGHINKENGCPRCAVLSQTMTKEEFIERANSIHSGIYDYSNVNYVNGSTHVEIVCPKHGSFFQLPSGHVNNKYGCPTCALVSKTDTKEQFIEKARSIHGDLFDYSKVIYINSETDVEIICRKHGSVFQKPKNHLSSKSGCFNCSNNVSKSELEFLEFFNIPKDREHRQRQIIIGNKTYKLDGYIPETNTVYEFDGDYWHGNPKVNKNKEKNKKTKEKHEAIVKAGYNLLAMWESDFNDLKKLGNNVDSLDPKIVSQLIVKHKQEKQTTLDKFRKSLYAYTLMLGTLITSIYFNFFK